jgi:hypothetical protein
MQEDLIRLEKENTLLQRKSKNQDMRIQELELQDENYKKDNDFLR